MAQPTLPCSLPTTAADAPLSLPPAPVYPTRPEQIPPWYVRRAPYRARFARTRAELQAIQRLRFRVFNLEFGEGHASARAHGRDADPFDEHAHHLLVIDERDGIVVGTYRLATIELVTLGGGFASEQAFDPATLPAALLAEGVELGRACVAAPHRGGAVLEMLWEGIAAYMRHNRKRWLFGSASLPAAAAAEAPRYREALRAGGHGAPSFEVRPRPGFEVPVAAAAAQPLRVASLVRRYLELGAQVCGEPALAHACGTLEFFLVLDFAAAIAGEGCKLAHGVR